MQVRDIFERISCTIDSFEGIFIAISTFVFFFFCDKKSFILDLG